MVNFCGGESFKSDYFFTKIEKTPDKGVCETDFWYAEDFKKGSSCYKRVVFYDIKTKKLYSTIDFNAYRMFECGTRMRLTKLTFDFKKLNSGG